VGEFVDHEGRLVERVCTHDSAALAELYDRFAPVVYRIGIRLMDHEEDAEDVVQDVFLGLPRMLATFQARGSLEGWIKRVTVRVALMKLRQRRRRKEVSLGRLLAVLPSPPWTAPVERLTLEVALGRLPRSWMFVFVLKEIEGFGHNEIASLLGITAEASKSRLHRARKRLRAFLQMNDYDVASH
jgi:RNA polymerase sigma-70 factor, ECF subfamily